MGVSIKSRDTAFSAALSELKQSKTPSRKGENNDLKGKFHSGMAITLPRDIKKIPNLANQGKNTKKHPKMCKQALSSFMRFCRFMHREHKPVFSVLGDGQKCDILFGIENTKEPNNGTLSFYL